jgi:hypothetical protein
MGLCGITTYWVRYAFWTTSKSSSALTVDITAWRPCCQTLSSFFRTSNAFELLSFQWHWTHRHFAFSYTRFFSPFTINLSGNAYNVFGTYRINQTFTGMSVRKASLLLACILCACSTLKNMLPKLLPGPSIGWCDSEVEIWETFTLTWIGPFVWGRHNNCKDSFETIFDVLNSWGLNIVLWAAAENSFVYQSLWDSSLSAQGSIEGLYTWTQIPVYTMHQRQFY